MIPRLVITGMGAVTPIGIGVASYWDNLISGACGIKAISRFDAGKLPSRIAGEIEDCDKLGSLPNHLNRSAALFMRFAFAAAEEALDDSGLKASGDNSKMGICMGTALAGADEVAYGGSVWETSNTGKISPHLVPKAIANMAAAHLAIVWGIHGPGLTLCTACSAGGDTLMSAALLILAGEADCMVVMAGESAITPCIISSLAQAKALSRHNEAPMEASRPFDSKRDGFVVGEGGGALILESEQHALKRGANIHAELAGWGNTLDGYHVTAPNPEGEGAALCMQRALKRAQLSPKDIDYINAHGTATILGDIAEINAIKKVFGRTPPPISSTKGATGHLMGAGGLTEIIACIKAIQTGIMPPTLNLDEPDPQCDIDCIPKIARKGHVFYAMSNSLGFGGQNSSIIIKKYMA